MTRQRSGYGLIFYAMIIAVLLGGSLSAFANDELSVTGIVKKVDAGTRTVIIDVKSSACSGERRFTIDNPATLADSEGTSITFFIDSNECKKDVVYKMILPGGTKR
ncbi:MAG: hypothetical protein M0024_09460 [Nitrospiraceae bacterium]|nr:hypothetical protein [Nitrospiraceae bacterium]